MLRSVENPLGQRLGVAGFTVVNDQQVLQEVYGFVDQRQYTRP